MPTCESSTTPFQDLTIKEEIYFVNDPSTGRLWKQAGEAENALAQKLHLLPEGTAVLGEKEAWFLMREADALVLVHAEYENGNVTNIQSRFDFELDYIDVEEGDLEEYIRRIEVATEEFNTVALQNYLPT